MHSYIYYHKNPKTKKFYWNLLVGTYILHKSNEYTTIASCARNFATFQKQLNGAGHMWSRDMKK